MHILSVAYPFAAVREDSAGGAEQVLRELESGVCVRGWRSTVVAACGSQVTGQFIAVPVAKGVLSNEGRWKTWHFVRSAIERTLSTQAVDLVHFHGFDFYEYLPAAECAVLVTLHLPIAWYDQRAFERRRRNVHFNFVSKSQRASWRALEEQAKVIENGVRTSAGPVQFGCGDFVLSMGRICPEKNLHVALAAGRKAGVRVLLAGQVFPFPEHHRYFQQQILPNLDGDRIFIGPVGGSYKRQLLADARCVLIPSLAPETSSLVAMEALASGTPVIAYATGALTEIVQHGQTGFLVRSESEMADAISRAPEIDRDVCRETARKRFGAERMIEEYLQLYRDLCNGHQSSISSLRGALSTRVNHV